MPLTRPALTSPFQRIVWTAVAAGVLAGLLLTGVQKMQVSGIILQAEVYEDAAAAMPAPALQASATHEHADGHADEHEHAGAHEHEHEHDPSAWQPADGIERTLFTVLANVSMGVAFALLLGAAFCMRGETGGWRAGLLWGAAGYVTFFLAPSLGLPPEVPGTAAAPLVDRQIWWAMTALATGSGLAMVRFAAHWPIKLLGALMLLLPHWIGAPQVAVPASTAPAELAHAFIYATGIANAAFWLALGTLAGFFYKKSA